MKKETRYLVLSDNDVFLTEEGDLHCLTAAEWHSWQRDSLVSIAFDSDHEYSYHLAHIPSYNVSGYERINLRQLLDKSSGLAFQRAGKAVQYLRWYQDHRFCGRCGRSTSMQPHEPAMLCEHCNLSFYPRLSPCVIGLVTKGDYCLLAWHQRSPSPKFSCLAGFIEPGETPEQAFVREVKEEVGLDIQTPVYFTSQPWPFPGQLMLGFGAEFKAGEIVPEPTEIREAAWFRYDQLPSVPGRNTISGQLISYFVESRLAANKESSTG